MKKFLLLLMLPLIMFNAKAAGHYITKNVTYGGLSRVYYLYIPAHYDSTKATPMVLVLHGLGDTISNFKSINMNLVADTATFIFAMPQALLDAVAGGAAWSCGAGELGYSLNQNIDDVGFLNSIIDSAAVYYNIDQTRLYCTGFSLGGFMTNKMGCQAPRLAAIASVSGTFGNYLTPNPTRAVPACHFHGTADQTISYTGDQVGNDPEQLVAYWRAHDHCDSIPTIDTLPQHVNDGKKFVHYTYANGNFGSDVEFYKVIGGQHQWIMDANINYSVAIWQFFYKHQWTEQVNAVNEVATNVSLKVFPNPANDVLNIEYDMPATSQQLTVTDLTGRIVLTQQLAAGQGTQQVNVKGWAVGSYTYNVRNSNGNISSKGLFVVGH